MKTQYVTDGEGKKVAVILPIEEYNRLMEELEELEDVKLYDQAKKEDDGERIPLTSYVRERKPDKDA